jgi:glycosyltransferase involved in cell wall biosynthesis
MASTPYFSIVVPVYNRPVEIERAIKSCLSQDFADFEIVIVDDASTDTTRSAVLSIRDNRVRLLALQTNRGECPARNAGVDAAQGDWIVWLDSDHEFLPNALARLKDATLSAPDEVARVGFMCRFDDGRVSPFPPPTGRVLPMLYHLDFASVFCEQWIPEVLVLQHTDAPNRLSLGYWGSEKSKRQSRAMDDLQNLQEILAKHGPALTMLAPRLVRSLRREVVIAHTVAGHWVKGIRMAIGHCAEYPMAPISWAVLFLVVCGSRAMLLARTWRCRRVEMATSKRCAEFLELRRNGGTPTLQPDRLDVEILS